jgi:hypothetical protein
LVLLDACHVDHEYQARLQARLEYFGFLDQVVLRLFTFRFGSVIGVNFLEQKCQNKSTNFTHFLLGLVV